MSDKRLFQPPGSGELMRQGLPANNLPEGHRVSAAALHTARVILRNWQLTPIPDTTRNPQSIPANEYNVALMIDVCTNVFRLEPFRQRAAALLRKSVNKSLTADEIQEFLYDMGIAYNYLPRYRGDTSR